MSAVCGILAVAAANNLVTIPLLVVCVLLLCSIYLGFPKLLHAFSRHHTSP